MYLSKGFVCEFAVFKPAIVQDLNRFVQCFIQVPNDSVKCRLAVGVSAYKRFKSKCDRLS